MCVLVTLAIRLSLRTTQSPWPSSISASRWPASALASTIKTESAFSGWSSVNVVVPSTAAATQSPRRSTPFHDPSVTFHAITARLPEMNTSAFEKHGPVKTSAVRAST